MGPPDMQEAFPSGGRVDHYRLARGVVEQKKAGQLYATLVLSYDGALRLHGAKLEYDEMKVSTKVYIAREITAKELARRKLPTLELMWTSP